jgi:hypothetical protein
MTQDIEIFANYCVFMRSIYLHARELFETSSAEDKALMRMTAGTFFGDLNRVLNEYVILQVCKITDPAQDIRNNDNHTIAFLLQHYDFSDDPPILKRLNDLRADMQAFREKLLPARNKLSRTLIAMRFWLTVSPPRRAASQDRRGPRRRASAGASAPISASSAAAPTPAERTPCSRACRRASEALACSLCLLHRGRLCRS